MRRLILVVHVSLDGFVAGPNGELDGFASGEENLQFVNRLTNNADAALVGRKSYELLNSYWPTARNLPGATKGQVSYSNWYNAVKKIVISGTMADEKLYNTLIIRDNIADEIAQLKKQEGRNILIFGSPSVSQTLMAHGLIDSYWIFLNPVIFGQGIPLFSTLKNKINLKLSATESFPNGEVAMNYQIVR